ncbi:hypothetical protein E2C01_098457 [Portunus trituberculatus]|uniref:Uncharacterized protein n=1 Tax=Portunus trituberculatus TaxID=210409 RepID=A0A5B7K187_PORTR|nr:hypothetical protein [Portunus trituberculatus]
MKMNLMRMKMKGLPLLIALSSLPRMKNVLKRMPRDRKNYSAAHRIQMERIRLMKT